MTTPVSRLERAGVKAEQRSLKILGVGVRDFGAAPQIFLVVGFINFRDDASACASVTEIRSTACSSEYVPPTTGALMGS